jgi:NADH/NAD ratio-sensing transcriptional regulator Rex
MVDKIRDWSRWFTAARLGIIGLTLNFLFICYVGIARMNTVANTVQIHEEKITKIEKKVDDLDKEKVDKETLQLILNNMSEIKQDVKSLREDLILSNRKK